MSTRHWQRADPMDIDPLDDAAMRVAIRAAYDASSGSQRADGRDWYPKAGRIVASLADWADVDHESMAAILATLSPRNPWAWNVQDAAAFAHAATHGASMPRATTFGANARKAWTIATHRYDARVAGHKVRSFVANIVGDPSAVTVDVWAMRVATNGKRDVAPSSASAYQRVADAYRAVALDVHERPCDLQAIIWVAAQGTDRRSAHGRSLKRGTGALVNELLTGQRAFGL